MSLDVPVPTLAAAPDRSERSARRSLLQRVGLRAAAVLVLLAVWQLAAASGRWSPVFVPAPAAVWDQLVLTSTTHDGVRGYGGTLLVEHLATSLRRILLGSALGVLAGVALGVLMGTVTWVRVVLEPLVTFVRALPPLAYFSLLIIWFGIDKTPKIWLLTIAAAPPVAVATTTAVAGAPQQLVEAVRALGAGRLRTVTTVVLPAALPEGLTGVRLAVGIAYSSVVAAETVNGLPGIGGMVRDAQRDNATDVVLLGLFAIGLSGLLLDAGLRALERRVVPWRGRTETPSPAHPLLEGNTHVQDAPYAAPRQSARRSQPHRRRRRLRDGRHRGRRGPEDPPDRLPGLPERRPRREGPGLAGGGAAGVRDPVEAVRLRCEHQHRLRRRRGRRRRHRVQPRRPRTVRAAEHPVPGRLDPRRRRRQRGSRRPQGQGVADVADLEGKKVATSFSSTAHYSLLAALDRAGIDPASLTLIDLEPQDILAAWTRGDIDAAYTWLRNLAEIKKTGTVLVSSRELATAGKPTLDLGVVSTAFAEDDPDAVDAWRSAQARALRLLAEDQPSAAAAVARQLSVTPEVAAEQLSQGVFLSPQDLTSPEWLGTPGEAGQLAANLRSAAEFLARQKQIPAVPPLEVFEKALYRERLDDVVDG